MTNPETQRESGRKPLGTRGTSSSPDNNLTPFHTPGPLGVSDLTQQCVESGADVRTKTCQDLQLRKPFLVGLAIDQYLTPKVPVIVTDPGLKDNTIRFGQDVEFSVGRAAPNKQSVGTDEATLKSKMRELLKIFASGDKTGMAKRLFDQFLNKNSGLQVFGDKDMNAIISKHTNFLSFSELTLAAPGTPGTNSQKTRIHQALKKLNWDLNKVAAITDLGVPAFNLGSKGWSTGDFNNGLGVMINGVQVVLVYAEKYHYHCERKSYDITLRFVLYDVFGLDDDDLKEFGADSEWNVSDAKQGITAWWQLQHQFGYAPLLTRAEVTREFKDIPAI
jgi:hypothetical protein